jgi:hypothetical protein
LERPVPGEKPHPCECYYKHALLYRYLTHADSLLHARHGDVFDIEEGTVTGLYAHEREDPKIVRRLEVIQEEKK